MCTVAHPWRRGLDTNGSARARHLACHKTKRLMSSAVIRADGHTYDRSAIALDDLAPDEVLRPNRLLQRLIDAHRDGSSAPASP